MKNDVGFSISQAHVGFLGWSWVGISILTYEDFLSGGKKRAPESPGRAGRLKVRV